MREPSLKWMMIAVIVGLSAFVLANMAQIELYKYNPSTSNISLTYQAKYDYLAEQQSAYSAWGQSLSMGSIFSLASELVSAFASAIVMGLSALKSMVFTMFSLRDMFDTLGKDPALAQFPVIFGLLVTVFMIWLTYRALSEARGTVQT